MLTVMTWFWQQPNGRTEYTAHHVNIWADMVQRHLTLPHRLACVTDCPEGIREGVEIIEPPRDFENVAIPSWGESFPQCLRRLAMFAPDAGDRFGKRFVNMDIDCVIGDSLDPLFAIDDDFRMYRGTSHKRPYNGSMVLMDAGARPWVYTRFTPQAAIEAGKYFIGSDQAWISYALGWTEPTWGVEHGVHWSGSRYNAGTCRLMFFPGKEKPWQVPHQKGNEWVVDNYRQDRKPGVCVILGNYGDVWSDCEDMMRTRNVAGFIASPAAAKQWTGGLLGISSSEDEARRTAWQMGYDDILTAGRFV